MRQRLLFIFLLCLVQTLGFAQRYTGKALEMWKTEGPIIRDDSIRSLALQDSMDKAVNQGDWAEAIRLQDVQWGVRLDRRVRQQRVDRAQAAERSEQARLRAEKSEIENRIKQRQLESVQAKVRMQRLQLEKDSANAVMERLRLEQSQLQHSKMEEQLLHEKQQRELLEQMENRETTLLRVSILVGVLLLLLLGYYLYRRLRSNRMLKIENQRLAEARDKALSLERMKTLLVQNMSHEIRNPLNAIVGLSDMLSASSSVLSSEERKEMSKLISQNSDQLLAIISDIVDMSNLESGLMKVEMASTLVNEACHFAISAVKKNVPYGVDLRFTSDVDDDFCIVSDVRRLRQVLVNYLTNACKYTSEGEIHLHVSTEENPGMVTFSVSDTGTGVPLEKQHLLFQRFEKLDDRKQGIGLGLNICRLISEQLQGEVKLDADYKQGARFLFLHPIKTVLLLLAFAFGGAFSAWGQDNFNQISDADYKAYADLGRLVDKDPERVIRQGDSLYALALKQNKLVEASMYHAQMLRAASVCRSREHDKNEQYDARLDELSERMRSFARKHELLTPYIYWAWKTQATHYSANHNYDKARELIEEMKEEAMRRDDKSGLVQSEQALGDFFMDRRFFRLAFNHFQQAADDCIRYLPDQDAGQIYYSMVENAEQFDMLAEDPKQYEELVDKGLKLSKKESTKALMKLWKMRILCAQKDSASFFSQWPALRESARNLSLTEATPYQICEMTSHLFRGETREAVNYVRNLKRSSGSAIRFARLRLLGQAYLWTGRPDRVFTVHQRLYDMHDSLMEHTNVQELTRLEMSLEALLAEDSVQLAKSRFLALQEENEEAQEALNQMHLDSVQMQTRQAKLKIENDQQRTALEMERSVAERERFELERKNHDLHQIVLAVIVGGLLLALLLLLFFYFQKTLATKRLRRIRDDLKVARQKAEEQDAQKTAFFLSISHEVRTPLNAIVGFSDMLASYGDSFSDEEKMELSQQIRANSIQISDLVNDILLLSRLESGKAVPLFESHNLYSICTDAFTNTSAHANDGVLHRLVFEVPEETTILTDKSLLNEMLVRLLGNAFKFTQQGEVRLVVKPSGEASSLLLLVEDTGVGVSEEVAERMYERFYKADSFMPGSGLGLSIVQTISACLNIDVQWDKSYGEGTRFVVKLPLG